MVNVHLRLNYWTVNHMQFIYVIVNFGRLFVINSRIFMQWIIKPCNRICKELIEF